MRDILDESICYYLREIMITPTVARMVVDIMIRNSFKD